MEESGYQCSVCKEYFETKSQLTFHQTRNCKLKICGDCGEKFPRQRGLLHHRKNRENIVCTHCTKTFCNNEHFSQHECIKDNQTGEEKEVETEDRQTGSKDNECEVCKESFDNPFQLITHQRKKCKLKICEDCGATFPRNRDLLRHRQNRKNISCTHCPRTFCSDEHFNKHIRSIKEVEETGASDLEQPIQPSTGYENEEGYKAVLKSKESEIRNKEVI